MDQFLGSVWSNCLWSKEDSICWENTVWIVTKMIIQILFYVVSCMELAMGIWQFSQLNQNEISWIRYLLWGFFVIYVFMMLQNTYTAKEKLIFSIMMIFGMILYWCTGINTGIKAPIYIMAVKGIDCRYLAKGFLLQ